MRSPKGTRGLSGSSASECSNPKRVTKEGRELALDCGRFILQLQYWTDVKTQRLRSVLPLSHEGRLQLLFRGQFHLPLDILAQSNKGRKLCAFSRYRLYRPCFRTATIPTLCSTRRGIVNLTAIGAASVQESRERLTWPAMEGEPRWRSCSRGETLA